MSASPFDIELDDVTLARARRGRVAACEVIYRKFAGPAYTVAFRICQCRETAQEVSQEAFITAFRKIGQFRGDAPFWGWLRRVVVNHAISALRRGQGRETVPFDESCLAGDDNRERMGLAVDLERALAALDGEDRAVVWLHDVEGFGHREIADFFGKTESFSKTRLSRARARLRAMLNAEGSSVPAHRAAAR